MTHYLLKGLEEELSSAEAQVNILKSKIAGVKKANPEILVGQCFKGASAALSAVDLIKAARKNNRWLAHKCIQAGPGAAADSGEALIVVIIEELCQRLESRVPCTKAP